MTIEIEDKKNNESVVNNSTTKKTKKVMRKKAIDIKHVARKLIMSWKQASEKQTITWKEIAPIIDSIDYLSSHWKNDSRLKEIEPVAMEIVEKINKIHVELNLRVYGMNRLRMITDELLEVLKSNATPLNTLPSSPSQTINSNEEQDAISHDKLKKLINSLIHLSELLKIEIEENSADNASATSINLNSNHPRHKSKKRNIFYGLFGGSQKQSNSSSSNTTSSSSNYNTNNHYDNSSINMSSSFISNSSIQGYPTTNSSSNHNHSHNHNHNQTIDTNANANTTSASILSSTNFSRANSQSSDYRSNIVSEWQEYTRKFVEPSSLFKVCRCYLNATPSAIPEKASVLAQNWICIANEISVSLWNVLRKREDDLASSLIFLTLYQHSSLEIIERAINTIGSQLPDFQVIRLKIALGVLKESDLNKDQLLMLQSDYEEIMNTKKMNSSSSVSSSKLGTEITKHVSNKKSQSFLRKDKKNKSSGKEKSNHNSDNEGPLSFEEMLAM